MTLNNMIDSDGDLWMMYEINAFSNIAIHAECMQKLTRPEKNRNYE